MRENEIIFNAKLYRHIVSSFTVATSTDDENVTESTPTAYPWLTDDEILALYPEAGYGNECFDQLAELDPIMPQDYVGCRCIGSFCPDVRFHPDIIYLSKMADSLRSLYRSLGSNAAIIGYYCLLWLVGVTGECIGH